ncbi:MAG: 1-phosphofructokinase family hexose kinase [Dictyoglomaceae bacterium]|nr:1-phosphofructokinase family hexose kinase [Dictyoglomaceae bacterium]
MILIVNLNPSLDIVFNTWEIKKGKVHRSKRELMTPGGKGINVAKTLKVFGEDIFVLGFCGGSSGKILKEELDKREIPYEFIESKSMTRFAIGIMEEKGSLMTVINGSGEEIEEEKIEEFFEKFKEYIKEASTLIISGSLPLNVPENIYAKMLNLAKNYPIIKVVDARGKALLKALEERPDIIKPNREEAEEILEFKLKEERDLKKAGDFFQLKGVKNALISLGEKGAFLNSSGEMYYAFLPPTKGINWGTGDAFLAGFIYGLIYNDPIFALKLACATAYVKVKKWEIEKDDLKEIFDLTFKVNIRKL